MVGKWVRLPEDESNNSIWGVFKSHREFTLVET